MQPSRSAVASTDPSEASARRWWRAGLALCVLMLGVHAAAGLNSAGMDDFWRDMYWATAIGHGERFPLAGPQIYQLFELGPWWFYLLAVPMGLSGSVALTSAFVQVLAALKYVLAWRLGLRIRGARLGFAFAASLAVAGWSTVPFLFPSHTALVETTLLLLAFVVWRSWIRFSLPNACLLGLVAAACLHAHPTTASYVVLAGLLLLWRHRSRAAFGWMALAASVAALSLLPPWLDRGVAVADALKSVPAYLGGDVAVHPLRRTLELVRALVTGGAWWGFLLMTPWKLATARVAWGLFCACLAVAAFGLWRVRGDDPRLFRLALVAAALLVVQVAFTVLLRPVTPMWMVPACLPPLAFLIAVGWYGWLLAPRLALRRAAIAALALHLALSLAPFSILLRDLRTWRVMSGASPLTDAVERGDDYVKVTVPFYPTRRLDRLARSLCGPAVLHGRLAAIVEAAFATPVRNACGAWPDLRYGGVAGRGVHLAGLLPQMATATGIAPARVAAGMALYERVRAIAPAAGGTAATVRRLQIHPDAGGGPTRTSVFEFDTAGADVVVLTNRLPNAAPMKVERIQASGALAVTLGSDGSSFAYRCDACAPAASAHWRIELEGTEANLDLVVLLAPGQGEG